MESPTPSNQSSSSATAGGAASPANILERERGQAWVRVIVCLAALVYFTAASYPRTLADGVPFWLIFACAYAFLAVGFLWGIARSTVSPTWRRYLVAVADVSAITAGMILSGERGIPLFALYLWVTLGNGFRFGAAALAVSATSGVLGFTLVLATADVWRNNIPFAIGVFAALTVVPIAAAIYILYRSTQSPRAIGQLMNAYTKVSGVVEALKQRRKSASAPSGSIAAVDDSQERGPRDVTLTRERGQAILRVVVSSLVLLYLLLDSYPLDLGAGIPHWLAFLVGYVTLSGVLAWQIVKSRSSAAWRRYIGNVADVVAISFTMTAAGESGIPLFALYLWVTFGNGFRYGIPALIVSTVLSVLGFSAVVALTPIWQEHPSLIIGVLTSLTILPLYAGHLLRLLNTALAKANEANAAKSQFIARMSHELRTPLNGIRGSVELLRGSPRLLPDERALLDVIDESVGVSLRQIENVLDFSKLEAGKLALEQADLDLHALVNSTVAMVRPAAAQKRLRLLVRISPQAPYALVGDGHHLRAILLNLLSNAVKFTEQGFVSIDVTCVEDKRGMAKIRFEVLDTGIGIAPGALSRIFDSFSQEDTSTTRRYGGTGLGTTIAKQLVELMGGHIAVQSIKGRGTLFWFEIPFARSPAAGDPAVPSAATAVVVSNNSATVSEFKRILDHQMVHTASEEAAIELVARGLRLGNPIYAVFVDHAVALGPSGEHRMGELAERASVANVPLIWVADHPPSADQLRDWGYAASVPRDPSPSLVFAAIHASPYCLAGTDPKVVSIAPWVWDDRGGDRPKILVADDNRTNLMITSRMLERAGYEADMVETGDQAAERLSSGRYRLAVLDMHMPGLDGPEVARQYRSLRPRSRLPIIVLTANASIAAQQACAEAGADSYLSKPVTSRKLLSEVKRLLDETTVEVLPLSQARRTATREQVREDVIDISVLAELDRIYRDPDEFEALVQGYEHEGREVLRRLTAACGTRSHAAYCDIVHALKSNAANVGARQLMELCRTAGAVGIVEFLRDRDALLGDLERAFVDSVAALRDIAATVPRGQSAD